MAVFKCPVCGWKHNFKGREEYDAEIGDNIFVIDESYGLDSPPLCEKCDDEEMEIMGLL